MEEIRGKSWPVKHNEEMFSDCRLRILMEVSIFLPFIYAHDPVYDKCKFKLLECTKM